MSESVACGFGHPPASKRTLKLTALHSDADAVRRLQHGGQRYYRRVSEGIVPNANFSSSNKPGGAREFKESFLIAIKLLRLHKPQL